MMVVDLGQGVEAVIGQHHLVTGLVQENLGGAADRAAVVDHHDGQGRGLRRCRHFRFTSA